LCASKRYLLSDFDLCRNTIHGRRPVG
jgi:hypothetical protein